jgi:hypothetical protein
VTVQYTPAGGLSRDAAASLQVARRTNAGGRWLTFSHVGTPPPAVDTLIFTWFPEVDDRPLTLLASRCQTGGAGSAVKFAMWRHDPVTGRPTGLPPIGQNAGLSTATSGTWQDLVVANVRMNSPGGWWLGWNFTGTLPSMISSNNAGIASFAMPWPVGSRPTVPRGALTIAQAYTNDIMAFDATGAALVESAASSPALYAEYA